MDEPQVLASGDCSSNIALPVHHDIPSQIQHRDQSRARSRSILSGADTAGERCSVPDSTRAAPIADDPNPPTYPRKGSIEQREAVFTIPLASRVRTCESSLIAGGLRVCSSWRAAVSPSLLALSSSRLDFGGLANGRARMAWARKTYF